MVVIVHPEFDPETGTWFWDEYEAPTLRALQRLLGPGVVIQDYYPSGMVSEIAEIRLTREQMIRSLALKRGRLTRDEYLRRRTAIMRDRSRQCPGRSDATARRYARVMELWGAGLSAGEVLRRSGEPICKKTIYDIVAQARREGDPRAAPRLPPPARPICVRKDQSAEMTAA